MTDISGTDLEVSATPEVEEDCPKCLKPLSLCVCADVEPIDNRIELLILQHPQEQDKLLGTARLTALHFKKAVFKVGLSWSGLNKALGRPQHVKAADPKRWATLYLGSAAPAKLAPGQDIVALDSKGQPLADQAAALTGLHGIILLDGTWSQAKTLWWRNAWLLKSRRIALNPRHASLYGKLRREPRREGLSTLEAAALLLSRLEGKAEIETALTASFSRLLTKYKARGKKGD